MKNKLIVIGFLGIKRAYLNLSKEEAVERYKIRECVIEGSGELDNIEEIEFDDEFSVYDVWE